MHFTCCKAQLTRLSHFDWFRLQVGKDSSPPTDTFSYFLSVFNRAKVHSEYLFRNKAAERQQSKQMWLQEAGLNTKEPDETVEHRW